MLLNSAGVAIERDRVQSLLFVKDFSVAGRCSRQQTLRHCSIDLGENRWWGVSKQGERAGDYWDANNLKLAHNATTLSFSANGRLQWGPRQYIATPAAFNSTCCCHSHHALYSL